MSAQQNPEVVTHFEPHAEVHFEPADKTRTRDEKLPDIPYGVMECTDVDV